MSNDTPAGNTNFSIHIGSSTGPTVIGNSNTVNVTTTVPSLAPPGLGPEQPSPGRSQMADVFISYAREDEARVGALVRLLEARGLSAFWDRQIPVGKTWREHISEALAQAPCVLVAWSTHSIASPFVAEEADVGRQRGVLMPVLIDAVLPPLGFRSLQAADLQDLGASALPRGFDLLLGAIKAVLADSPHTSA